MEIVFNSRFNLEYVLGVTTDNENGGGQANSRMFPKESRPPYLQNDAYFDTFKPEVALQAVMAWAQTMAVEKSNTLKENKVEKTSNVRKNTNVKVVEVKAGQDDATTLFHPQRFLRPPVVAPEKYWNIFPKAWEEKYYSVYLEDVGLQNELGQRQIELLHDRRSAIKIKMFAPSNVNAGRSGTRTTNIRSCEDGSADLLSKDDWTKLANLSDLEVALDNLVAAWAVFWPGDHSMVTLRRVVSKTKSFQAVANPETRMKLLEIFINQVLEQNQRKAMQEETPMTYKEVLEVAKDKLENVSDYFPTGAGNYRGLGAGNNYGGSGAKGAGGNGKRSTPWVKKEWQENSSSTNPKEFTRKLLNDQKFEGKEFCLEYNLKGENGGLACRDKRCRKAHNCAYVPRGESMACGGNHSKVHHWDNTKK